MIEKLSTLGFTKPEIDAILKNGKLKIEQNKDMPGFEYSIEAPFLKIERHLDGKLIKTGLIKLH